MQLKEKEEECAMALQELAKLDEYSKQIEKSIEEQANYINELEKTLNQQLCPKCGSPLQLQDKMDVAAE